jgi:hypothetical protein
MPFELDGLQHVGGGVHRYLTRDDAAAVNAPGYWTAAWPLLRAGDAVFRTTLDAGGAVLSAGRHVITAASRGAISSADGFDAGSMITPPELPGAGYTLTSAAAITAATIFTRVLPAAFTLTALRFRLATASSSGAVSIDVRRNGTSIFTQEQQLAAGETDSLTAIAQPYILTGDSIDFTGHTLTVVVTAAGTGAAGLTVDLLGTIGAALSLSAAALVGAEESATVELSGTYTGTPATGGIELAIFSGASPVVAYGAAAASGGTATRSVTAPAQGSGYTTRLRYRDSQTNAGGVLEAISAPYVIAEASGPPPPPPFTPLDLGAKTIEWLDFSNAATRTVTSGAYEQVVGRKSVLTIGQATAGARPALTNPSGVPAGVDAMTFDGVDDDIFTASVPAALQGFYSSTSRAIWIAGRITGEGEAQLGRLYTRADASNGTIYSFNLAATAPPDAMRLLRGSTGGNGQLDFGLGYDAAAPSASQGFFILKAVYDDANRDWLTSRFNGSTGTGSVLTNNTGIRADGSAGSIRFGNTAAGDRTFNGWITDVVYTDGLTAGEETDLITFLEARLGRTGLWV